MDQVNQPHCQGNSRSPVGVFHTQCTLAVGHAETLRSPLPRGIFFFRRCGSHSVPGHLEYTLLASTFVEERVAVEMNCIDNCLVDMREGYGKRLRERCDQEAGTQVEGGKLTRKQVRFSSSLRVATEEEEEKEEDG